MNKMSNDLEKEITELKRQLDAKQARIDELMIEYCPDEMTEEQWKTYEKHQVPVKTDETGDNSGG